MIADAIAQLRRDSGMPVDSNRRGPVPLERFYEHVDLSHFAVPDMTRGAVAEFLRREGMPVEDLGDPTEVVEGFLFTAGRIGWAFVAHDAKNILPRRRFTAAHELGHFLLHRDRMGRYRADTKIFEEADGSDPLESEANRFAAELLMPKEICEAREKELRTKYGICPRGVLAYRLASELLVSREAMRYRLKNLRIGDVD